MASTLSRVRGGGRGRPTQRKELRGGGGGGGRKLICGVPRRSGRPAKHDEAAAGAQNMRRWGGGDGSSRMMGEGGDGTHCIEKKESNW
jgi:hypothetical protein